MENQIGDYGELLKDCELKVCSEFMERLGTMEEKLMKTRRAITNIDSSIDLLRVKIGEIDVDQAVKDYLD